MTREKIDDLCQRTTKPDVLNALHACREGHPAGRGNVWKWRNAYSLVAQNTMDFLGADTRWIHDAAKREAA